MDILGHMADDITPTQIKMARGALDWSIRDLAKKAGLHHNTISRVENGLDTTRGTLLVLREALESAGIEFIAENGGGAGVRLAKRSKGRK